jgi:hypothetical protein
VQGECSDDIFSEDFEDGDAVGWTVFTSALPGTSTATVVLTGAAATTYGVDIDSSTPATFASPTTGIEHAIIASAPTSVSFWIRKPTIDTAARIRLLSGTTVVLFVGLASNGGIGGTNLSANTATYVANTWYHFEIRNLNLAAGTYDLYVNNALVGAGTFTAPVSGTIDKVQLANLLPLGIVTGTTAESLFDEIVIQ